MNNTRVNDNINYGFWVIMKCQCTFISFNKYTILEGNVDNGGRLRLLWGRVGMWEISIPVVQFCCEPKSALKNKSLFKKMLQSFPGGPVAKNQSSNAGDTGSIQFHMPRDN